MKIVPGTRGHLVVSRERLPAKSDLESVPIEKTKLENQLWLSALVLTLVGVIMLIGGLIHNNTETFKSATGGRVQVDELSPAWELVRDLGISLIGVGLVGVVYELFNRRAVEAANRKLFSSSALTLGDSVATQTTLAVLGDKRFIDEVLTDSRREVLLGRIIEARLDPSAGDLARRTAHELSGAPRLEDFRVTYRAMDCDGKPRAQYVQSFYTTKQPNTTFSYFFQVVASQDERRALYGEDVFTWFYWLGPGEKKEDVLPAFKVTKVVVNDVALATPRRDEEDGGVGYETDYVPEKADRYYIEQHFELPAPKEGSFFYAEPRYLCKAFTLECDVTASGYQVVVAEMLRAGRVDLQEIRDNQGRITQTRVHTAEWVLPTAAVSCTFYTATKEYNKPSGGPNVSPVK